MGALIFYIAVYFIGYYAAHLLNQMIGQASIRNRRVAGLVFVLAVGIGHGYKIISTPPPHDYDYDDGAGYALGLYVIMPVAIIVIAVLFLMWRERYDKDI